MRDELAVIDVTGLASGDEREIARVARDLFSPCTRLGAFHVVGHDIPASELARFEDAMHAFFALPGVEKEEVRRTKENAWGWYDAELTKNRRDWKEIFDYGPEAARAREHSDGVNQWPRGHPALREALLSHYAHCERLALALLEACCVSLGLSRRALSHAFRAHTSFLRLNRYAPCRDAAPPDAPLFPEEGHLGVYHHTDAGALTILLQDEIAGLQFEQDGRFETVLPLPGALTVNLGDMLQVFSNDRFRSPVHRVIVRPDVTRYSAPFFLNPSYDAVVAPLAELTNASAPPRYRPFTWAEFRSARAAGDYADEGPEVQIAHYRQPSPADASR